MDKVRLASYCIGVLFFAVGQQVVLELSGPISPALRTVATKEDEKKKEERRVEWWCSLECAQKKTLPQGLK